MNRVKRPGRLGITKNVLAAQASQGTARMRALLGEPVGLSICFRLQAQRRSRGSVKVGKDNFVLAE
jgi:hypothetical protein